MSIATTQSTRVTPDEAARRVQFTDAALSSQETRQLLGS